MCKNTENSDSLFLLLARPADSLCTMIQSWAMAAGSVDLIICHSLYEIICRLDDIPQNQTALLITRPAMLQTSCLSVLQSHLQLRLILWTQSDQPAADQIAAIAGSVGMVTASTAQQLSSAVSAFQAAAASPTPTPPQPVASGHTHDEGQTMFDPTLYRLCEDEIKALLEAE